MKKLILFGGLGMLGYGVYTYYKTQFDVLYNSKYALGGVKIVKFSKDNVTIQITINVTNNSEQEFNLQNYDISIILNNTYVGSIKSSNLDVLFKGYGQVTPITFDYSFNPKEIGIANTLYQLATKKTDSDITINGSVRVKKGFISVPIPIDFTSKLKYFI